MSALAVALLAATCWNPFATSPDPTVTIWVKQSEALVRWPRDDTTRVRLHNRIDDLNGFAGLEVAQISERWELESKIQWDLHVDRAPYPLGGGIPRDLDNPECRWETCASIWRSTVDEGASNYEGEALWVVLYRNDPDEW